MKIWKFLAPLAAVIAITHPGVASADMAPAEILASTCFACHGPNGVSVGPMPTLATKDGKYIASNLRAFRDGQKQGTIMDRITKGFSDAEIDSLASYFDKIKK